MRLDKYLSTQGMTRSVARDAIRLGRVHVDGQPVRDPSTHIVETAQITLDGVSITSIPAHTHIMLHKPAGVITAASDARSGTVFDLLPRELYPRGLCAVGRLDRDTTGLLLFTTDGQLAHRLISPKWVIEKEYLATVDGMLNEDHIGKMAQGIALTDFTARPAKLDIISPNVGRLTVTEGKYHQVKRMFGSLACPVIQLHRARIGNLTLDPALSPGQARALSASEAANLYQLIDMEAP